MPVDERKPDNAIDVEDSLAGRRNYLLSDGDWKAFQEALDRPVSRKPRLARLLNEPGVPVTSR